MKWRLQVELKKDPALLGLAALVIGVLAFLMHTGRISWAEMLAGLGLMGLPSIFGRSSEPKP